MVITKATNTQHDEEAHNTKEGSNPPFSERSTSPSKTTKTKKPVESVGVSATVCANCGTTTTPLWRRAPNGDTICNACGLYMKARNAVRPHWLKRNTPKKASCSSDSPGTCPGDGHCNGTGGSKSCSGCPAFNQHQINRQSLVCANCSTTTTPLWRRDESGATICNACGLYYKLHGRHRPVSMKRSVIKRRKRMANGSNNPDDKENTDGEDSDDDKSASERSHHSEPPGSPPGSPKKKGPKKDKDAASKHASSSHKDHHDHDPNSCNHDLCRQNVMKAGHVPALEDYGKPVSKQSEQKRVSNKISGRESEHKPKRKYRRTSDHQNGENKQTADESSNGHSAQWTSIEAQASSGTELEASSSNSNSNINAQAHFPTNPQEQASPITPENGVQSLQKSSLGQNEVSTLPSNSPSLYPPMRDARSQSPHVRMTSSPHVSASSTPPQRPNRHGSHDFTLPPIYEQRPHLPPISMSSMPTSVSNPMSYHTQGYAHPTVQAPAVQPTQQPIRYSPNPQPASAEYYSTGPSSTPIRQPTSIDQAQAQGASGSNITKEDLEAHRMELQREVSHLSLLLSRTTAILAGLDQAVTSKEPSRHDIPPNAPSHPEVSTTGPPYWDGGARGYQVGQPPYPGYQNQYYPSGVPVYQNNDEFSKLRYSQTLMQPVPQPPYYQASQPPQQPPYDQRPQPPNLYGNPQLPPLYPTHSHPHPHPPPSSSTDQPSQTIRY
ncbi:hypothetical protein K493DRAFT_266113 [Basidiobolus meristosporus CBS 931.73]|uniref:GATA-type domain-containing protein n=1 Tax=Basidiobolus meristosporus CBS 931.73 TaxID=1314790 RepID=A0A1Y1XWV0_9FUNG|nr:hypothetical protein K493DRAFT_266113 [Basidiobolus meristosporus CBS 931.73]|eukprot:ORX90202.1 hypothetical protein K493DRAFT_266113 [Basidiobolus meristosporus CBS 931.73]